MYNPGMALILYRRHNASCPVAKSKISARAKRKAMGCQCPIWMYGRTGNSIVATKFVRP
jgi:hypothetical protein